MSSIPAKRPTTHRPWIAILGTRLPAVALCLSAALALGPPASAQTGADAAGEERGAGPRVDPSPNNPDRAPNERSRRGLLDLGEIDLLARSIDGVGNNLAHPHWGAARTRLKRRAPLGYGDGRQIPAGAGRPSPRVISNALMAQEGDVPNAAGASDFLWQWGQFLDHDLGLTPIAAPAQRFDIAVPPGDPWFDPAGTGTATIPLERSSYDDGDGVRQQVNEITAFIDASNVYGSDAVRAAALRAQDGSGRLRTGAGDLLPYNDAGLPNAAPAGADPSSLFLAGDFRANEQVALTAMHVLFVREHNFWAARIAESDPELDGDQIYQHARTLVAAEMQAITYREFLPLLLGRRALARYDGYDPSVDPGISNEFAAAAFRVGHTMLSSEVLRLAADGSPIEAGPLPLAEAFFSPGLIEEHGIEPLLRGLAAKKAQEIDLEVIDAVRNLLFGPPGAGGMDLASLNIQRGRDHGLADYNSTRVAYGLPPAADFEDITADPATSAALRELYGSADDVDLWVGGLAEEHVPGALVGPTFHAILVDQFERLRDGDRFWYQRALPEEVVRLVEAQTLGRIIRRNTTIGDELGDDVFRVARERSRR